ncbi:ATP-binding protein [Streptomyces sp. CNQ-509]|uniref:ATP-binding protein n=1 Tax=Streptomyces sp. CNQ-509 TaxID=444103 RepID=UPI00346446A8
MGELEESAVLVVSELVTNAVVHARVPPGREIQTRFVRQDRGVRIEVHDASSVWPVPRVPDEDGGLRAAPGRDPLLPVGCRRAARGRQGGLGCRSRACGRGPGRAGGNVT